MKELGLRAWSIKKRKFLNIDTLYCANGKVCAVVDNGVVYDIEDVILEQDTGLKDRNGKKIREGDLIRVSDAPALKDKTLIVKFGEYYIGEYACTEMSGWLVRVVNSDWTASLLDEVGNCEVIGNIHENPGLLKEEE